MLNESEGWMKVSKAFEDAVKKTETLHDGTLYTDPRFSTSQNSYGMCREWQVLLQTKLVSLETYNSVMAKIDKDLEKVNGIYMFETDTDEGRLQRVAYALNKSQETQE